MKSVIFAQLQMQLVYANITSVMLNGKSKLTKNKIIESAKKEFLKEGYNKASLRRICEGANVTTGAFYFSFKNKEELLEAIVKPTVDGYKTMMNEFGNLEIKHPETAEDNEIVVMKYIISHKDEAIILLEKSIGSKYESFYKEVLETMEYYFTKYYKEHLGHKPNDHLMHTLAVSRFSGYLEIMKGGYELEESVNLTKSLGIHAEAGTNALIEYLKKGNDARR